MRTITESRREVPVAVEKDVIVVGGGPGGWPAAVAAARAGADVLLIERCSYLGGKMTNGLMRSMVFNRGFGEQNYGGLPQELLDRLRNWNAVTVNRANTDWVVNEEILKLVLDEMVTDAGASALFYTLAVQPIMEGSAVRGVLVDTKRGRQAILGKVVIDASGDGDVAVAAGAPYDQPEVTYQPAFNFHVGFTGFDDTRLDGDEAQARFDAARRTGRLRDVRMRGFSIGRSHGLTIDVKGRDATDFWDLSLAELQARGTVREVLEFLHTEVPGCEKVTVAHMSPQIMAKAARRVIGEYIFAGEDVIRETIFPDAIATGTPKSYHGTMFFSVNQSRGHTIPYRSLVPLKIENVLLSGQCFSSTYEAYRSHPIVPVCILLGQAAGTAAAIAVAQGIAPRQVDVAALQAKLREQGVSIPSAVPAASEERKR